MFWHSVLIGIGFWLPFAVSMASGDSSGPCVPGMVPDVLVYSELLNHEIDHKHYAVVVDKSRQELNLFEFQGLWRLIDTWPCSTGRMAGRKQREGDARTPEGIYFVLRNVPDRYLSDTYGAYALPLNYPNRLDRKAGRSGSAIWLHGTDKPLRQRDSNGCVVLENKHIIALAGIVRPRQTPIIIVDELQWWRQEKADQWAVNLISFIEHWQNDIMGDSYPNYQRWYASGVSATMEWWHQWCHVRRQRKHNAHYGKMQARNFEIYKSGNTFMITFNQFLEAGGKRVAIDHHLLYIETIAGRPRIVGDEQFASNYRKTLSSTRDRLFAAWRKLNPPASGKKHLASQKTVEDES
jgi:hypothetical protein